MTELGWTLYLINLINNLNYLACLISIIGGFAIVTLGIAAYTTSTNLYTVTDRKIYTSLVKWTKRTITIVICSLGIACVTPDKTTCYQIFAVNTAVHLYQSNESLQQLPEKSIKAINKILNSIIEKTTDKDE